MHTKVLEPKSEPIQAKRYRIPLYVERGRTTQRQAEADLHSPSRAESPYNSTCCCSTCCKICAQEMRHLDHLPYEVRRPTCISPRPESISEWLNPCTCTSLRHCSQPPPMHHRVGRDAALHTRSQLETIMNEMSDCCSVRQSYIHHPLQVCRQDFWMNHMRFRFMYKPDYRGEIMATKDAVKPKRFQCMYCEKSFGKSSHLRDHVRTHTGERPFRCNWCSKAFTQYSNLRTHMRIHTGEKPYSCKYCLKSFTQAVTLRSHLRTHSSEGELDSPKK